MIDNSILEIKIRHNTTDNSGDEARIVPIKGTVIHLRHSLYSVKQWEQKYQVPFLKTYEENITNEQFLYYIRCMALDDNLDPFVFGGLDDDDIAQIVNHIDNKMSATWFAEKNKKKKKKKGYERPITAELIYCRMIQLQVPMECQYWHLNQLSTLLRTVNEENNPESNKIDKDFYEDWYTENVRRQEEWAKRHKKG